MAVIQWLTSSLTFGPELWVRLTLSLLHFLWLGCAIALAAALLGNCLKRASSHARYAIYVAALLVMAACPPLTFFAIRAPQTASPAPAVHSAVEAVEALRDEGAPATRSQPAREPLVVSVNPEVRDAQTQATIPPRRAVATPVGAASPPSWLEFSAPLVTISYLLGVLFMLGRLTLSLSGGRRLRLLAQPVNDAHLLAMTAQQAQRIGLVVVPAIGWCQRIAAPAVVGIVKPMILLPTVLATGLEPLQLETLLAHELAHVRRGDLLVNLLQRLIEAVLFFHPAVWYVSRRISIERENACDDLVLSAGWPRVQYADALVRMAELCFDARGQRFTGQAGLLAATGENASQFKRRVLRLLGQEPAPALLLNRSGIVVFVATILLLLIVPLLVRAVAGVEAPAIAAVSSTEPVVGVGPVGDAWTQFGGSSLRNHASTAIGLPETWDLVKRKNILWTAELGSNTFGSPVVARGKVLIGTNNAQGRLDRYPKTVDLACLQCFDQATGKFLWQFSSEKLPAGLVQDWPQIGLCSTPCIVGDRIWLVTNRCEVVCLDLEGFRDGENDGPVKDEPAATENEADVVWRFDMLKELGVQPHHQSVSSITWADGLMLCNTAHASFEAPRAPSFIALHADTGRLVWSDATPGSNVLPTCPASSPAVAELGGIWQALFAGGDGWLYGFDLRAIGEGKSKLLWKFDCNPKTSRWAGAGKGDRNSLLAAPVVYEGRVYISVGRNPEEGEGPGRLWCLDPTKRGDISPELVFNKSDPTKPIAPKRVQACEPEAGDFTRANGNSGVVWQFETFDQNGDGKHEFAESMHRCLSSVSLADGLAFVADLSGVLHCLDARTGKVNWSHDLMAAAWTTPFIAGDRVYAADEEGEVAVFRLAKTKQLLAEFGLEHPVYGSFAAADHTLFLATKTTLMAVSKLPEAEDKAPPPKGAQEGPRPDPPRGDEAVERAKQIKPAWGETIGGLQFGIAFPGGSSRFRVGQAMVFSLHARNMSKEDIPLRYGWPSAWIVERTGNQVALSPMFVGGQMFTHRVTLKPGEERELPDFEQRPSQHLLLAPRDWNGTGEAFVIFEPGTKGTLTSPAVLLIEPEQAADWRRRAACGTLAFEVTDSDGALRQLDAAAWGEKVAWPADSWRAAPIPMKWSKDEFWKRLEAHLLKRTQGELSPHSFTGQDGRIVIQYRTQEQRVWRPGPPKKGPKGGGVPERRTEIGPGPDGFQLEISLEDEVGQAVRPQTLERDPWRVYLGEVILPELKTRLTINVSYGVRTDSKLLRRFVSPHDWLKALVDAPTDTGKDKDSPQKPQPEGKALESAGLNGDAGLSGTVAVAPATKPAAQGGTPPEMLDLLREPGSLFEQDAEGHVISITIGSKASDEWLAKIKTLPKLKKLYIETTKDVSEKGLAHLSEIASLESLEFYSVELPDAGLAHLARLPRLAELSLIEGKLSDAALPHLGKLKGLRRLRLKGNQFTDEGFGHLKDLVRLEVLDLAHGNWVESKMRISDAGIAHVARFTKLRELDISGLPITDEGFGLLSALGDLRTLNLSGTQITGQGLRPLVSFPQLETLILAGPWIDDPGLEHVGACRRLKYLALSYTNVTDDGFRHLSSLEALERLTLDSLVITDAGLAHLTPLKKLAHVELRASKVTDDSLKHLAQLAALTRLDLSGSGLPGVNIGRNFTGAGYAHLARLMRLQTLYLSNADVRWTELRDLKQLRTLSLMMPTMSEADVRELQKALPDTFVSAAWGGSSVPPRQFFDDQGNFIGPPRVLANGPASAGR